VQNIVNYQLEALINQYPDDSWKLFALCPRAKVKKFSQLSIFSYRNVRKIIIPIPARFWIPTLKLWQQIQFPPVNVFLGKLDVFLSPAWFFIPSIARVKASIVYDFFVLKFPEYQRGENEELEIARLNKLSEKSDLIISISEATKNDAQALLKIPKGKLLVAYPGVKGSLKKSKTGIKKELAIKNLRNKKYFLYVGQFNVRKNLRRVIKALALLKQNVDLVMVGGDENSARKMKTLAKSLKVEKQLHLIPWVPEKKLCPLYKYAVALIFPSLYEGFGLPIGEAYTKNTLVITSNLSSMPEVAGDAGILVNPKSAANIAVGMRKALEISPKQRKRLISEGRKHIKKFSYDKSAVKIMKRIKKLLKNENCSIS
jgi:glycosyltransferase involved in cell wall biosynthesis